MRNDKVILIMYSILTHLITLSRMLRHIVFRELDPADSKSADVFCKEYCMTHSDVLRCWCTMKLPVPQRLPKIRISSAARLCLERTDPSFRVHESTQAHLSHQWQRSLLNRDPVRDTALPNKHTRRNANDFCFLAADYSAA